MPDAPVCQPTSSRVADGFDPESFLSDSSGQITDIINSTIDSRIVSQLIETLKDILEKLTILLKTLFIVIIAIMALYCILIIGGCLLECSKLRESRRRRQREGCLASDKIERESVPLKDIIVHDY